MNISNNKGPLRERFGNRLLLLLVIFACVIRCGPLLGGDVQSISRNAEEWLYPIDADAKMGYINRKGDIVVEPKYSFAYPCSEGLGVLSAGQGHICICDLQGTIVGTSSVTVSHCYGFSEGIAVCTSGKEWFCINSAGRRVFSQQFESLGTRFSDGLLAAKQNGRWGYVNKTGTFAVSNQFSTLWNFSGGVVAARISDRNVWSVLDREGRMLASTNRCLIEFSDGLTRIFDKPSRKYGFCDKALNVRIPLMFDSAEMFSSGLTSVEVAGKYGYINTNGVVEITPIYDDVNHFEPSVELAPVSKNGSWGLISKQGEIIMPFLYNSIEYYGCGVWRVVPQDKSFEYAYIESHGKVVWSKKKN